MRIKIVKRKGKSEEKRKKKERKKLPSAMPFEAVPFKRFYLLQFSRFKAITLFIIPNLIMKH
jgi:hypothetical protein